MSKSLFEKVLSPFVKTVDDGGSQQATEKEPEEPVPEQPQAIAVPKAKVQPDPKMRDQINQHMQEAGPLMNTFLDFMKRFETIIPNLNQRVKAAEEATPGGPEDVMQALDQRYAALKEERTKFAQNVEERRAQIKVQHGDVDSISTEIAQHEEAIQVLRGKVAAIQENVAADEAKLEHVQAVFEATASEIKEELDELRQQLVTHLDLKKPGQTVKK